MFLLKEGATNGEGTSPETEEQIISYLGDKGMIVRTQEQENSYLQSHVDSVLSKRNSQLENTVHQLTGIKKEANQKWVDYMESSIKSIQEKPSEMQYTIDKLNKNLEEVKSGKVGNEQLVTEYKNQIETLQKQISVISNEKDQIKSDFSKKMLSNRVNSEINAMISSRKPNRRKDFDDNMIDDIIENRITKTKFELEARDVDGVLIWYKNGEPMMSTKDGKHLTTSQVFEHVFEGTEAGKPPISGGGSNNNNQGSPQAQNSQANASDITIPETVKTWVDLHNYLKKELKMDESTKEFSVAFDKLKEGLIMR